MKFETIDSVVKGALFACGKPIHYYIQFLHYALKSLKELNFDTLRNVKSVEITLNSDNTADLPADMVDWCKIGYATGQYITVMGQNDGFSREVQCTAPLSCLGSELVSNVDMELDSNWIQFGVATQQQSTTQSHTGNNSWYVKQLAFEGRGIQSTPQFQINNGSKYKVEAWIYPVDGTSIQCGIVDTDNGILTTRSGLTQNAWNKVSFTATATSTHGNGYITFLTNNAKEFYVDDVSVKEDQSGTSSEEANSNVSCYFSNLVNDHGELTGRIYGLGNGNPLSFKVIQERDVIQFDQRLNKGKIILEYITDGMSVTASTLVHLYAAQAIEDYIMWKYKQNNRAYNRFDVNLARTEYYDQVRRLRARLNPITATDIVRSSRSAFKLSIKP